MNEVMNVVTNEVTLEKALKNDFSAEKYAKQFGVSILPATKFKAECPSAFMSVQDKQDDMGYTSINVNESFIKPIRKLGWRVSKTFSGRNPLNPFTVHLINLHEVGNVQEDGHLREIVIISSHDKQSAFKLHFGVFNLVCANGMVIVPEQYKDMYTYKKRVHRGGSEAMQRDLKLMLDMVEKFTEEEFDIPQKFKGVQMSEDAQKAFAQKMLTIRNESLYNSTKEKAGNNHPSAIEITDDNISALISENELGQNGNNLWDVFNRIQGRLSMPLEEEKLQKFESRTLNKKAQEWEDRLETAKEIGDSNYIELCEKEIAKLVKQGRYYRTFRPTTDVQKNVRMQQEFMREALELV